MKSLKLIGILLLVYSSAATANKYADDFPQLNTKIDALKANTSSTQTSPTNTAPVLSPSSAAPQPVQGSAPMKGSPPVPDKGLNGTIKK